MGLEAIFRRLGASISNFFRKAASKGVPKRSFFIALVVGSILTAINQGEQEGMI